MGKATKIGSRLLFCLVLNLNFACALGLALLWLPSPVHAAEAGLSDDCLKGGIINERNGFGVPMDATTFLTDKSTGQIFGFIEHGVIPAGRTSSVFIPPGTIQGVEKCDAFNVFSPLRAGGGGGVGAGAVANLRMESLFFDTTTNQYIVESIFDILINSLIESVSIPDLWGDTTGDGIIDSNDTLYSLVDLRIFLNSVPVPTFSFGQTFSIVGGTVASLPGMMFSTTEFSFDPSTGFSGTPYTGNGVAMASHEPSVVPEPTTFMLLASGLVAFAGGNLHKRRRARRVSTKSIN